MKLLSQGAEAKVYLDKDSNNNTVIIKERIPKSYRIAILDDSIRKFRTKREAKVLQKCTELKIDVPKVYLVDRKEMKIVQEYIEGKKLRDKLNSNNYVDNMKKVAKAIAKLHDSNIIHGDLTTSNMILKERVGGNLGNKNTNSKIYLIDFGLSQFSEKVEDKAVDIHLFRQALESKHNKFWEKAYDVFLKTYKKSSKNSVETLFRLDEVQVRGRNKLKH